MNCYSMISTVHTLSDIYDEEESIGFYNLLTCPSYCFSGDFPCPVFDIVLKRITIRGSIVGTRKDMEEAIGFASRGNNILSASLTARENIFDCSIVV
jgi:D-arabinose 1-dehydrogenase-like Zn-dependent alcohol dehydrogenase